MQNLTKFPNKSLNNYQYMFEDFSDDGILYEKDIFTVVGNDSVLQSYKFIYNSTIENTGLPLTLFFMKNNAVNIDFYIKNNSLQKIVQSPNDYVGLRSPDWDSYHAKINFYSVRDLPGPNNDFSIEFEFVYNTPIKLNDGDIIGYKWLNSILASGLLNANLSINLAIDSNFQHNLNAIKQDYARNLIENENKRLF